MSVARARLLEPLFKVDVPLTHAAVVIGGGVAGMTSRPGARRHGPRGAPRRARRPSSAATCSSSATPSRATTRTALVKQLEQRLVDNPNVKIHLEAELADFHGFIGNFSSVISEKDGKRTPVDHGVVIVATGAHGGAARALRPRRRARRSSPAWTSSSMLKDDDPALADVKSVGFILCAGSLDENKPYCSRTCCQQSIKNAIALKEQDPEPPGVRVVQGGPHLRPPRGVLHQGA